LGIRRIINVVIPVVGTGRCPAGCIGCALGIDIFRLHIAGIGVDRQRLTGGIVDVGKPFEKPVCKIAPITAELRHRVYEFVLDTLSKEKMSFSELYKKVKELFNLEKYNCASCTHITYETVQPLIADGTIKTEVIKVDGVFEGITAPQIQLWI
jgi:hypothetical protein